MLRRLLLFVGALSLVVGVGAVVGGAPQSGAYSTACPTPTPTPSATPTVTPSPSASPSPSPSPSPGKPVCAPLPAVVRLSTTWLLRDELSSGSPTNTFSYGTRPLTPMMGDWDGDGERTPGTFEAGTFRLRNSNSAGGVDITFVFGDSRGFAVAGDWNGDGLDDVAVFRNGKWQTRLTGLLNTDEFMFGTGNWPLTVPIAGDWNGDGTAGVGTFTPSTGGVLLRQTANLVGPVTSYSMTGVPGYYPVVGDWDLDSDDSLGFKQNSGATWYLHFNNLPGHIVTAANLTIDYGIANDLPLVWTGPD